MVDKINEKLGAWLLREGNTREKLAELLYMSRPTLAGRLNGESEWTWNEVIKICELTRATPNELAGIDS